MNFNPLTPIVYFVLVCAALPQQATLALDPQHIDLYEFSGDSLTENRWLEIPGGFESLEPGELEFTTFPAGTFYASDDGRGAVISVNPGQVMFLHAEAPVHANGQPIMLRMTLRASSPWASVALIALSGDLSTGVDVDGSIGVQLPMSSHAFVERERRLVMIYEPNQTGLMTPAIQVAGNEGGACTVWIDYVEIFALEAETFGSDTGAPIDPPTPTPTMTPVPPTPTPTPSPTPTPTPTPTDAEIPVLAQEIAYFDYGSLYSLAYSPDGQSVLTGGSDGMARLWDVETREVVRVFDRHRDVVHAVAYSPDGLFVATGGADGLAMIWDADSGERVHVLEGHTNIINSVAFSSDGTQILTGSSDRTARLWDAATGDVIRVFEGHGGVVLSAAISPDGAWIATGSGDRTARLWNAATGATTRVITAHWGVVHSVDFSPDGTKLVTASGDNRAKVWSMPNTIDLLTFEGHTNQIYSAHFSPDGTGVLTGSGDGTAKYWDSTTGRLLATYHAILFGPGGNRYLAVFSPDGERVLAGGYRNNTPALWDITTGQLIGAFVGHTSIVTSVALSPDNSRALTASMNYDRAVRLWDTESGELVRDLIDHTSQPTAVTFSEDGTLIVTCSGDPSAKLWNAATGELIRTFSSDGHRGVIGAAAISPNGDYVLTGSDDLTAKLWNASTGNLIHTFVGHTARIAAVAFSPDGSLCITASDDRTAKLWNASSGELVFTLAGHTNPVSAVAFSPDGVFALTGSSDFLVKLWNVETGEEIRSFTGHTGSVLATVFSEDGSRVLAGSMNRRIIVWEADTGERVRTYLLDEQVDGYRSMAFSRDRTMVLTGSGGVSGGAAKLWDISNGEIPTPLPQDPAIVHFRSDAIRISLNLPAGDTPLDMALIPEGEFFMGSPAEDVVSYPSEHPLHPVMIQRSYYMGKYPVTQSQYFAVMGENPSARRGASLPVEQVSWYDAARFCNRLSEMLGLSAVYNETTWEADWNATGFRLPTEAEWEYAVRAGAATRYYWGNDPDFTEIDFYAWYVRNSSWLTQPVGQKLPNAWGLFDMSGNVWEWCYDWIGDYSHEAQVDPTGPETGNLRITRGGSALYSPIDCRSAHRRGEDPSHRQSDRGFRIVLPRTQ